MFFNSENEKMGLGYENFNQKFLCNSGVCVVFMNAFGEVAEGKIPMIRPKLRKILVDFGLSKTYTELCPELGIVQVYFKDETARHLKGILLQRFSQEWNKDSQAVGLNLKIDVCPAPKTNGQVRTYTGLTKFLFQEFIQQAEPRSLAESVEFYSQLREIIQKGNTSPSQPLQAIFGVGVE